MPSGGQFMSILWIMIGVEVGGRSPDRHGAPATVPLSYALRIICAMRKAISRLWLRLRRGSQPLL